jgi:hypothetical protein
MKLAEIIKNKAESNKTITAGEIMGFFTDDGEKSEIADIFSCQLPDSNLDALIKSSVSKVKQAKVDRRIQELTDRMNTAYQAGNTKEANDIFVEIKELQKLKR